jgi:putative toxin-antitoxin system antitoxin component (TIGR02293 family)
MSVLAERVEHAAAKIELGRGDLARALDANPRTLLRWLNDETVPRAEAKERMFEVLAVLDRLSATLTASAAHDWLFTPNGALEYHKPIDLLRAGEFRRVLGAIDALAEGVFV